MRASTASAIGLLGASAGLALLAVTAAAPTAYADLVGINPVRIDPTDPANSDFLVFIETDVTLSADESEGTLALGGDLTVGTTYNLNANPSTTSGLRPPTAPGDAGYIALFVGGQVDWTASGSNVLRVLGGGFTKVEGGGFTAFDTDQNGASALYRVVAPGASYDSTPRIEGTTSQQSPASVGEPVGDLVDIPGAFAQYRELTAELGTCEATLVPTDASGNALPRPITTPGTQVYLDLSEGDTNVLNLTAAELANIASYAYRGASPVAGTTMLVNVTGGNYSGIMPNQAGLSAFNASFVLWNFPDADSLTITGGDTLRGTLYAPNADLQWAVTQNIEGNVVAKSFLHGTQGTPSGPREIHDHPFLGEISCVTPTTSTSEPATEPPTEPTTGPTTGPTSEPPTEPTTAPPSETTTPVSPSASGTTAAGESAGESGGESGGSGSADGGLPSTGGPPRWLALVGAALVVAGATVAGVPWLRRTRRAH